MSRFDYFVILAEMRTGSNFLEENLNHVEGVTSHGEAFNPSFIGSPKTEALLGVTLEEREAKPFVLLERIKESDAMAGFRLFHNHDPRIVQACLEDPRCAKVILRRNPLDSFVSWKIAQATGQWKLTNATHSKSQPISFDISEFRTHLDAITGFQKELLRKLQVTGQTAFQLDYDDLQDVEVLNGLLGFLQSQNKLGRIKKKIKKQNPESQKIKIKNFDEMSETLKEVDWFGLWGMSSFEPQRGPSIPSYIAAGRSGLLYAPLKSGPDAAVKEWLERLDGVQPLAKFTQRSLREWYEQHLPHRSFTVVRHPVARAHAAFCDRILIDKNGRFAEIRANLRRVHKLPIPQEAPSMTREDGYDLEAHKTAFAAFLKFLRLNISGQTSIRVDPTWASQHALLHGVTQFACPDAVLREEELHTALPSLAAAIGKSGVPEFINARHPYQDWLDEIYDLEIEKAARAAYARDYEIFGFRDWA